jgi:hypothetical protein
MAGRRRITFGKFIGAVCIVTALLAAIKSINSPPAAGGNLLDRPDIYGEWFVYTAFLIVGLLLFFRKPKTKSPSPR